MGGKQQSPWFHDGGAIVPIAADTPVGLGAAPRATAGDLRLPIDFDSYHYTAAGNGYFIGVVAAGVNQANVQIGDLVRTYEVQFRSQTAMRWQVAAAVPLYADAISVGIGVGLVYFGPAVAAPTIYQIAADYGPVAAPALLIAAADNTNGAGTGGGLDLQPGDGATDGALRLLDGAGTMRVLVSGAGDVTDNGATAVYIQVAGNIKIAAYASELALYPALVYWPASTVAPSLFQYTDPAAGVTGDDTTIAAQNVSDPAGNAFAGDLGLRGGQGLVHANNKDGNLWCHVAPAAWQAMEKGIFEAECVTAPTGNPVGGIYRYTSGGAGVARGTSGTVTTYAPAGPHCPVCGYDHPKACYANARFGSYFYECAMCGHIERQGPADISGLLTPDERAAQLRAGDHAHNLALMLGQTSKPRARGHSAMLMEYERAATSAIDAAKHDEAAAVALDQVRDVWDPMWRVWIDTCDAADPGSADDVPDMIAAADKALDDRAAARPKRADVEAAEALAAAENAARKAEARRVEDGPP